MITIGNWHAGSFVGDGVRGDLFVYVDDSGILRAKKSHYVNTWDERVAFKKSLGKWCFDDERFLLGVDGDFVDRLIAGVNGKSKAEISAMTERMKERRENHRAEWFEAQKRWEQVREKFNGVVIGIEKMVDVYESGFSIRVLFKSDVGFGERKKFLQENRAEFLRWVMKEISESKNLPRKIGDIRFYKPVEIVNLRIPEVEVKFEVKGELG